MRRGHLSILSGTHVQWAEITRPWHNRRRADQPTRFARRIVCPEKILFHGRQNWNRLPKERPSLLAKTDDRTFGLGDWQQRESLPEDR